MAKFEKLNRVCSHSYMEYIPNLYKEFPELKDVDKEELANRFRRLQVNFYRTQTTTIKFWQRLTLPFAIIVFVVLLCGLPLAFIATGRWEYGFRSDSRIMNWLRMFNLS